MMDGQEPYGDPRYMPNLQQPPHNFEAEKALLGGLMAYNGAALEVAGTGLNAEHFADPVHGRIYDAILFNLEKPGGRADPVTLRRWFEADGALQDVGGPKYLAQLAASMVSGFNLPSYAGLIVDLSRQRDLLHIGNNIVARAYSPNIDDTADTMLAAAESALSALSETQTVGVPDNADIQIRAAVTTIEETRRNKLEGRPVGRSTGLVALDRIIGGFKPGRLYIFAARPSMGKSALAVKFAEAGGNCWCYSGEMPASEWHDRRLGIATKIPPERLERGDLSNEEMNAVANCSLDLSRSVHIDDTPRLSMAAIRRRALRYAERHPTELLIADHLGKIAWADPDGREVQQLGLITGGFKDLAKEMGVPAVLLVQLNRGVEGRDDKRPGLSDLRGSGNIEEDADAVAFLYREAYYLERMPPVKGKESDEQFNTRLVDHDKRLERSRNLADLMLAKQRGGATGTAHVYFNPPLMEFGNLAQDQRDNNQQGMDL